MRKDFLPFSGDMLAELSIRKDRSYTLKDVSKGLKRKVEAVSLLLPSSRVGKKAPENMTTANEYSKHSSSHTIDNKN